MSYVSTLEQVVQDVSEWAVQLIEDVISQLSPEGRPFGMDERPESEQMAEYMNIVGDANAWATWIQERSQQIITRLEGTGILPEDIATIKPFEIASAMAMEYSERMEKLLNRNFRTTEPPSSANSRLNGY